MGFDTTSLLALLGMCLVVALFFSRLGVSALVAYMVTGVLAGPHVFKLVDDTAIAPLAEMGATLLLFALGLELDVDDLRKRLRIIGTATIIQMGLTIATGAVVLGLAGHDYSTGAAVGACLAMSSTLLVLRTLEERRLRGLPEGQLAIGICLMQDVALGPLLVLLTFFIPTGLNTPPWKMGLGVIGILSLTIILRRVLASLIIRRMRAARLGELEVVFAVIVALGAAALTHACGLGMALGAFCAGLAFGSNDDREVIDVAMKPLQGLMAIFFFVSTGLLFDPNYLFGNLGLIIPALVASITAKTCIAAWALRLTGLSWRSAFGCGILVGNIGEFSFVLAGAVFSNDNDPRMHNLHQLVITITLLSFFIMPLLMKIAEPLLPRKRLKKILDTGSTIVVAGLGPVGNTVVDTLRSEGLPLLLIDRNERLLKPWHGVPGVRCHQGRIEDMEDWLPLLGHRPSLVVLTFPIADASALVTDRLRSIDPKLIVIARSPFAAHIDQLRSAGARYVICDETATANALMPLLAEALLLTRGQQSQTD